MRKTSPASIPANGGEKPINSAASMMSSNEVDRLSTLHRYEILDTEAEASFDSLARLAAEICGTSIGLITFIDDQRQFFKAAVGFAGDRVSSLEIGFCPQVVRDRAPLVIDDTLADPQHADNPAVTEGAIRFYAGVPLITHDDQVIGTLCVLDTQARPQKLPDRERQWLEALATQVVSQLELRRLEAVARREHVRAEEQAHRLSVIAEASTLLLAAHDPAATVRQLFELVGSGFRIDMGFHYRCGDGALGLIAATGLTTEQERSAVRIDFGQSVCGIVAQRREPMHVAGIQASTEELFRPLKNLGLASYYSAPLLAGSQLLGTISFGRRDEKFSSGEIDALQAITSQLATAIERQHAEDDLRLLNETLEERIEERSAALRLYQNIVQSNVAPVVAFDRQFKLIAFNQAHIDAYKRAYGIDQQMGDRLLDQFLPDQAVILKGLMERALNGESFTVREEFGDPALEKPSWEVTYNPLYDDAGAIIGAFHIAVDITAEVRNASALAEAQDALRQSQKLEAIGQLTGGVAHDFNNLLTIIRGSVELLKRPGLVEEKRRRYIDAIAETTDRAAKLTGQLLSFARRQALTPELTDIGAAVEEVTTMVRTLTGSRVVIDLKLPKDSCLAEVDRSQFETAIVNLAVNARDAMDGEGRLTIAVGPVSGVPALRSHPGIAGDFVAVTITDDGAGIANEDLIRIFEPFFTTKGVGKGTGLGLSQVIGFTKQSGGDVGVESIVGESTTFSIYLPRIINAEIVAATSADDGAVKNGEGFCVLLVEDNPDVGRFAQGALEELGYESIHAADATLALSELEQDPERFDVMFSDVVMPGMDGVELGTIVRKRYPNLPVILTSGYSHVLAENGQHGFELLHKPYSIEQLSRVLRKAIAWRLRQLKHG